MAAASGTRPEHMAPAEVFYDGTEAKKYTSSSRIIDVQAQMAHRCIELMALPPGHRCFILDIGCGSGLSGEALSSAGHAWVGTDISADMLTVGLARGTPGDTLLSDMGQGLPFRTGSFDGAISVSAVQWLCYATQKSHQPYRRIRAFFASLYRCLKRGARAALQIYPENAAHLEMLSAAAAKAGFRGGLVVDFPNSTKAKKYYLCLVAGSGERDDSAAAATSAAGAAAGAAADSSSSSASDGDLKHSDAAMEATDGMGSAMTSSGLVVAMGRRSSSDFEKRRRSRAQDRVGAHAPARKEWVLRKKEQRRAKGLPTRSDSKYTGRRRPDRIT
ncbi:hypothetical protein FNF28_05785 [Cafeteria roenbergensis]|uniref:18S rRNA (guanine(1575)-N(7))-methyltransferase Bud23 C-terminal domain-containing protein n=1 Tax=Cafeteria roenbergensis TaxID=33653 RepID=A0A5A8D612_CAFRO|nr:hypothetical protein FNF28_05785 [Cafeteria roenbergensis]